MRTGDWIRTDREGDGVGRGGGLEGGERERESGKKRTPLERGKEEEKKASPVFPCFFFLRFFCSCPSAAFLRREGREREGGGACKMLTRREISSPKEEEEKRRARNFSFLLSLSCATCIAAASVPSSL